MRKVPNLKAERCRVAGPAPSNCGHFRVSAGGIVLDVLASDGGGWDHVSVSLPHRCPTWEEMELVRSLFFRDDECVMQLSVPRSENVNTHNYCLHWWRPQTAQEIAEVNRQWLAAGEEPMSCEAPGPIPRPPAAMV